MSDSIQKDDEKFNDLVTKQPLAFEPFAEYLSPKDDCIDVDDDKLEKLLYLQDITQGPVEDSSLEEKYEEEIMINEVIKMLDKDIETRIEQGEDPFEPFFIKKEDE